MQKKLLIALVVIIAAGAGVFAFTQSSKAPKSTSVAENVTSDDSVIKGSIKSLLGQNKNLKCTYSNTSGEGTIYSSGQKVRADMMTTDEKGNKTDAFMVNDGEFTYIWSSASKEGTKIKVSEAEALSEKADSQSTAQNQSVNMNEEMDMKCSSWGVDSSKFAVPSDVKFTDMSDFLKNLGGTPKTGTPPSSSSAPAGGSVCDSITDPQAKAACQSAISGN